MSSTPIPDILKGYTFHKLSLGYGARPKGPRTYLSDLPRVAFKNIPESMRTALTFAALIDGKPNINGRLHVDVLGFQANKWEDGKVWIEEKCDE